VGKKSKEKKKKEKESRRGLILKDSPPPLPQIHTYKGMQFSSIREAGIARFIFERNIETESEEIQKLVALICEHKILHDNESEIRFANLLRKNNLRFEYSKRIKTKRIVDKSKPESPDTTANKKNINVEPNTREIDFWLVDGPILVPFCAYQVQAFEIKGGALCMDSHRQQRELKDSGYYTFVATPNKITAWEKFGLLEPVTSIRNVDACGIYRKPTCLMKNKIPDSESEVKHNLVKVLRENHINFEYIDDDRSCPANEYCHRAIFFLRKPVKGFWCGAMTQAIMLIEDDFTLEDIQRWEEISERFNTFIADWNFVQFWQRYGFLRQRT